MSVLLFDGGSMNPCTFQRVIKQKGKMKFVLDCGICLNCLMNLNERRIQRLIQKRRNEDE
mgnify:CR=1 FL=1